MRFRLRGEFRLLGGMAGFALLEVLMALALFASVATALATALQKLAVYSRQAQQETLLLRRLESALVETASIRPLAPGRSVLPVDASGVSLVVEVSPEPLRNQKGEILTDLYRITATARLSPGDLERRLEQVVHAPPVTP
ncbi:MAG: prepilin-type N-terminal cleavage/methylation domain-containing protein [Verrucomicrobiales bacterium]|nr:prepilin-type N-terminal cleavage/methylation domain-containing protein [Verrucomicrobiales bacterium]